MRFTGTYQLSIHLSRHHLQCRVAVLVNLEIGADLYLDIILFFLKFIFKEYF